MPVRPKNLSLFSEDILLSGHDPFFYENTALKSGYSLIAGVDEAGRGSLAGPVVAAAAIIPHNREWGWIKDSKQMTAKVREQAVPVIQQKAMATSTGVVSHTYIDDHNILKASLEAMKRAILLLSPQPDFLLVDGIQGIPISIPQKCLKKGDQISKSISAASVLAKVYRDKLMCSYHKKYPLYHLDKNKGYGTRQHLEALKKHGPTPIHRLTFRGVC